MRCLTIVSLLLLVVGSCWAADQGQTGTISLQLNDVDITQALTTLSQQANVTVLGDTTVKGKVTCSLSGLTTEQALDTICKMNKLEWYKTYAGAGTELSASKLFKLLDAL